MKLHNKESLNSIFTKIINVSSSSEYNVNLFGFNCYGRTDLMISPSCIMCEKLMNYCNIQLKPMIIYKYENSAEIIKYSDIKNDKLSTQSLAEFLSYIRYSNIMHFTTDLNQNFHIMFLTENENKIILNFYNLSGTEAIATIPIGCIISVHNLMV
jgi:hypothetical protein